MSYRDWSRRPISGITKATARGGLIKATLDQAKDLMTLDGSARIADPTGSASADRIVMNQKSGDFSADGHVASTHMPDQKGNSSAMLATDEVMQARAQKMTSRSGEEKNNQKIHYEGNAVAWQGANRVEADRLDIDRDTGVMEAHGKVKSQFADKDKAKDDDADGVDKTDKAAVKAKAAAAPDFHGGHGAGHGVHRRDSRGRLHRRRDDETAGHDRSHRARSARFSRTPIRIHRSTRLSPMER